MSSDPPPTYHRPEEPPQPAPAAATQSISNQDSTLNTEKYNESNNNNNNNEQYHFRQDQYYNLNAKGEGAPIGNSFEEIFPDDKPRFNDWPFTIFFVLNCFAFVAIAGLTLHGWNSSYSATGGSIYDGQNTGTLDTNAAILLVFSCTIALTFSILGFILCRCYPKQFIYIGMAINIASSLGTAICYLCLHYWSAGIVFIVFTALTLWCYIGMRHRIPLAVAILRTVMDVIKWYPFTIFTAFLGSIISAAFAFFFSLVVVACYMKYDPKSNNPGCNAGGGSCSNSKLIGMLFITFFCGFYISEVIKNVLHSTISGIYGCWYYMAKSDQGPPKWPAWGSFKRSITYSFGSICFGSLIVSIIETFRAILQVIKNVVISGSQWAQIGFMIIDWVIGFFNWLASYFNHYAYSYIALYGKSYLRSAKETWNMMREKGFDALINDNLVNIAIGLYSMFVSYMCALFAFLYLRFTKPSYNSSGGFTAPLIAFSFVIALQICNIINETIRSGVATFFIALANDPEVFQKSYPERFDEIFRAYPDVLKKLSHQNV
ncbi:Pns1p SCDLUD_003279 [Saccharomycodes ludwigii]|uniref:Pns1p n=1 Tax=Saccharomycodes ludwigii TaxID=36035 RepID=UPI001E8B303F|nr:hypothetical protein SCDLUD_003279 [Saccharomycodes ludwigii]KAH3900307.1 hypothetical protein SCDLUD_003279 [Saccharomycodes ludwigii]